MKRIPLLSLLLLLPSAAEEKVHGLRVLALGNRAPFKQEVRDGVRYEIDPPEGSLPPRELAVGFADESEEAERMRLRLGECSARVGIPAGDEGTPKVTLREADSGSPWLRPELASGESTLLLVWRFGTKWDKVRSLAIDDSPGAVPAGSTRVVNVCSGDIGVTWGTRKLLLKPGREVRLEFPTGAKAGKLTVQYVRDGGLVTAIETEVENDPRTRRQWVVFQADRKDARQPVQVLPLAETR